MTGWLQIQRGDAPLIVSIPHTGTEIPADIADRFTDGWRARRDADWHVEKLYDFAGQLGATLIRTAISRSVIDVNRDPSGASLYPGRVTTGLCPTETFDGQPLYRAGYEPDANEISRRRQIYFAPYHAALEDEIARLRRLHAGVVLYDAHSIRSRVPRLFEGALPQFNIGSNDGNSCAAELAIAVEAICARSGRSWITNGRFKGGWITRHYGAPARGVHAIQMELACSGYMREPEGEPAPDNWPSVYDAGFAEPLRAALIEILQACLNFARAS